MRRQEWAAATVGGGWGVNDGGGGRLVWERGGGGGGAGDDGEDGFGHTEIAEAGGLGSCGNEWQRVLCVRTDLRPVKRGPRGSAPSRLRRRWPRTMSSRIFFVLVFAIEERWNLPDERVRPWTNVRRESPYTRL